MPELMKIKGAVFELFLGDGLVAAFGKSQDAATGRPRSVVRGQRSRSIGRAMGQLRRLY